jgi:hypothetical protein
MNIRLTPKGLNALKTLAGEAGLRPGELVTKWVEERLEAERSGSTGFTGPDTSGSGVVQPGLEARVNELASRIAALEARGAEGSADKTATEATASVATDAPSTSSGSEPDSEPNAQAASDAATSDAGAGEDEPTAPRRRGRPPKAAATVEVEAPKRPRGRPRTTTAPPARSGERRIPLHEEIIAVITEGGPQTAAELATAITARGIFQPPRSGKPLDAATVNSRVSNPVYRARFVRDGHKIALADG